MEDFLKLIFFRVFPNNTKYHFYLKIVISLNNVLKFIKRDRFVFASWQESTTEETVKITVYNQLFLILIVLVV